MEVLQYSVSINYVHPPTEAVPAEIIIGSLRTSTETIKKYAPIIKEEGSTKADEAGVHSYLWDGWVMEVYPLVLPPKVNI